MAAPLVIAPSLALVGPGGQPAMTESQENALNEAFDRVDRFRMQVVRVATGETVLDTIITVTPGQDAYDLSVSIDVASPDEQFSVTLTAMEGTTELFTSEPVTVQAVTPAQAATQPPPPTNVTMQYSGPGVEATSIQVSPATLVLGPGGGGSFAADVQDSNGNTIADAIVAWSTSAAGVADVADGTVTAVGEGAVEVIVATPAGLEARAWVYVVGGELAYAEGGAVKVRAAAGGEASQRSSESGAAQPAWSPDGNRLFYVAGGRVYLAGGDGVADGEWPSVSPDGTKLAVERSGTVYFVNDDGTHPTEGPEGATPVWSDAASVLVSGGSVQRVRADGSGRTTLAEGSATLPARSATGEVAYVMDGALRVVGRDDPLLEGAQGRPSWSANGLWLVVPTAQGITVVPAAGGAPGALLPGLEGATDPAFKPSTPLEAPPPVSVTGLDPSTPIPGEPLTILGSGFDWIIPENNHVFFPTHDGVEEGEIDGVTETEIRTMLPRAVADGQIRVETRSSFGLLAFEAQLAAVDLMAADPFGDPVEGVIGVVRDAQGALVLSDTTDATGRALMAGLLPGDYTVEVAAPEGYRLESDAAYHFTLGTETVLVEVELTPLVASVTTDPEVLSVEVDGRLEVTLLPVNFRGEVMERLVTARWVSGAPYFSAAGDGLTGAIVGAAPTAAEGEASLTVHLNGDAFSLPVTVTSYVEGTVEQDPDPAPQGSSSSSEPQSAAAETEPAPGIEVKVMQDGAVVSTGTTDVSGHYHAGGLLAGTYTVTIDPVKDRSPVPDQQTVTLSTEDPTATADFLMSRAPVDSIALSAPPDSTIRAFDGTITIVVEAFDSLGNPLPGRRAVFTSLATEIASVDASGVVTGEDNGTASIEVTVESKTDTIDITVDQEAVQLILLEAPGKPFPDPDPTDPERAFVGDTGTVGWEAYDANGYPITHKTPVFMSSDPTVVSIDPTGFATLLDVGPTEISGQMDGATDMFNLLSLGVHTGDLVITGPTEVAYVQSNLIGWVKGNVYIDNTLLTDLTGLETLTLIDAGLYVRNNAALVDVSGLGRIIAVQGDLFVENNPLLTTPSVPESADLEFVGGLVSVVSNPQITHLDMFGNLQGVAGGVQIIDNASLQHLEGLDLLEDVFVALYLEDNPSLNSLNNLPSLRHIDGDLVIEAGAQVFGLPMLESVTGVVQVGGEISAGNTVVEELHFPSLLCAGGVSVYSNDALTTLSLPLLESTAMGCSPPEEGPPAPQLAVPSRLEDAGFVFLGEDVGRSSARSRAASRRPGASTAEARIETLRSGLGDAVRAHRQARAQREAEHVRRRAANQAAHDQAKRAAEARMETRKDDFSLRGERGPVAARGRDAGPEAAARTKPQRPERQQKSRADGGPQREYGYGGGSFEIWGNPGLINFALPSLQFVEGMFELAQLPHTAFEVPLLEYVGEDFQLYDNPALVDFSAPSLTDTGWDLDISDNPVLVEPDFPVLTSVGDDVWIYSNGALGDFTLPALQFADYDIEFYDNTGLTSINLPVLTDVYDDLYIDYNDGLTAISIATSSVLSVGYDLEIYGNSDLQTINIPGLTYVYDDLAIYDNTGLVSVTIATTAELTVDWDLDITYNESPVPWTVDVPGAEWLDSDLWVADNVGLQSVTVGGTVPLEVWSDVYFSNNADLQTVSLPTLTRAGSVQFYNSPGLQSVSAPDLTEVSWDLWLDGVGTAGTPVSLGFGALASIKNELTLNASPGLSSFSLPALGHVQWGVYITDNPTLTSVSLPALAHLGTPPGPVGPAPSAPEGVPPAEDPPGEVFIQNNPALTSFPLPLLEQARTVVVDGNASLTTLPSLASLSSGTHVVIENNSVLDDLAGLAGVTGLYALVLENNPDLSDLSALGSLTEVVNLEVRYDGAGGLVSLPALTRIWGRLDFLDNPDLTGLSAPALTQIGDGPTLMGQFFLANMPSFTALDVSAMDGPDAQFSVVGTGLANLNGLSGLLSQVYEVNVSGNPALTDVFGLSGIGTNFASPAVANAFYIINNPNLSQCDAQAVKNTIDGRNPGLAFGGPVDVMTGNQICAQQE